MENQEKSTLEDKIILLTSKDLMARFNVSRTQIYSMIDTGMIPKPIETLGTKKYWVESEIEHVIKLVSVGVARPRVKEFVKSIHAKRKKERVAALAALSLWSDQ